MAVTLHHGDAVAWANAYAEKIERGEAEPFHALYCDPPYSLNFMGKSWDDDVAFRAETWRAFMPVMYPGAFGMAFASSRGLHRMMVAIEDAGFVLHPVIMSWAFGSGFPKATNISAQIDRNAGAVREVVGKHPQPAGNKPGGASYMMSVHGMPDEVMITAPATPLAKIWQGHRYGLQALKPAIEPIIVFSKPHICYNELQELMCDTALLLEEVWTRFASSADAITEAGQIVRSVLERAATVTASIAAPTSVSDAGQSLSAGNPKSKRAAEPTAPRTARTPKPGSGSTVPTAESQSINGLQPSQATPASTCIAAENATATTGISSQSEPASSAGASLSPQHLEQTANTAPSNAPERPESGQCSTIHCATVTATTTAAAMLQFNSERAEFDLSTIWLWSIIWDDAYPKVSKSITETGSRTTTALRTLNSSLRRLMLSSRDTASLRSSSEQLLPYARVVNASLDKLLDCLPASNSIANRASLEPIIVFQKPYAGRPVDAITTTGAGALWIDGARIETRAGESMHGSTRGKMQGAVGENFGFKANNDPIDYHPAGRWPSNLLLQCCGLSPHAPDCPVELLGRQSGERPGGSFPAKITGKSEFQWRRSEKGNGAEYTQTPREMSDTGTAARFFFHATADRLDDADPVFYTAKASRSERDKGLSGVARLRADLSADQRAMVLAELDRLGVAPLG